LTALAGGGTTTRGRGRDCLLGDHRGVIERDGSSGKEEKGKTARESWIRRKRGKRDTRTAGEKREDQ